MRISDWSPDVWSSDLIAMPSGAGRVRGVRTGQPVPGTTRIVFDLSDRVAAIHPHFEPATGGSKLVLEWPGERVPAAAVATTPAPTAPPPRDPLAILTQGAQRGDEPVRSARGVEIGRASCRERVCQYG